MPQDIYQISDAFRDALLKRERAAASQLVRAYGLSWQRIQIQLARLTRQIEQARARGEDVNQFWLMRQERYFALQGQVLTELRRFIDFAEPAIIAEQKAAVEAAQQQAVTLMSKATNEARAEGSFNKLSPLAVERMVGFAGDGSPLRSLLNKLGADAALRVSDALTQAVALGYNPKKTATQIREAMGGNLARALLISRTETIRAHREASRQTYLANSDVCLAWQWVAALGPRSCPVCWAMHGTIHPLTEPLASHPACRCTTTPIVEGMTSRVTPGAEEFAKLGEAGQRQILGPGKFAAYKSGLPLENLVGFRRDPRWGPVRWERSLSAAKTGPMAGAMPDPLPKRQPPAPPPQPKPLGLIDLAKLAQVRDVKVNYYGDSRERVRELFGRKVNDAQMAAAVGALDGARVDVGALPEGQVVVAISHPHVEAQKRVISRDARGHLFVYNELFMVANSAPKGTGLRSFSRQAAGARALGVRRIETFAAGDRDEPEWNGYYTWARFGYNAPLSSLERRVLNTLPQFRGARDLNDLILRGGAKWWKEKGDGRKMVFNLDGHSRSIKILLDYLREKGVL